MTEASFAAVRGLTTVRKPRDVNDLILVSVTKSNCGFPSGRNSLISIYIVEVESSQRGLLVFFCMFVGALRCSVPD